MVYERDGSFSGEVIWEDGPRPKHVVQTESYKSDKYILTVVCPKKFTLTQSRPACYYTVKIKV